MQQAIFYLKTFTARIIFGGTDDKNNKRVHVQSMSRSRLAYFAALEWAPFGE